MRASRRTVWMRSGLLALVVFALLAFTLHSLRLSDASFTAASSAQSTVFITGTLGHINNSDGQVLITMTGMKPNTSSAPATLILTGTGDVAGDYTLSVGSIVSTPATSQISSVVCVKIEDASGDELCDDPIGELDPVDLGSIAPEQVNRYTVTLYYPDGATNGAAQSSSMMATLQVEGVSQ
jgi:hypothetical protein